MAGGVDSAFRHVSGEERLKFAKEWQLFQVKGKRVCRVQELERPPAGDELCAEAALLNQGDCFVLVSSTSSSANKNNEEAEAGGEQTAWQNRIFVIAGKEANKYEKTKAAEVARALKAEHEGYGVKNIELVPDVVLGADSVALSAFVAAFAGEGTSVDEFLASVDS